MRKNIGSFTANSRMDAISEFPNWRKWSRRHESTLRGNWSVFNANNVWCSACNVVPIRASSADFPQPGPPSRIVQLLSLPCNILERLSSSGRSSHFPRVSLGHDKRAVDASSNGALMDVLSITARSADSRLTCPDSREPFMSPMPVFTFSRSRFISARPSIIVSRVLRTSSRTRCSCG